MLVGSSKREMTGRTVWVVYSPARCMPGKRGTEHSGLSTIRKIWPYWSFNPGGRGVRRGDWKLFPCTVGTELTSPEWSQAGLSGSISHVPNLPARKYQEGRSCNCLDVKDKWESFVKMILDVAHVNVFFLFTLFLLFRLLQMSPFPHFPLDIPQLCHHPPSQLFLSYL